METMKKLFVPVTVLCLAVCGVFAVGDEVKSGLQPGSFPGPFGVLDITGPAKGETLCYRCKFGDKPVVSIFARSIDDNLAGLLKSVDGQIEKNKQLNAFFVLLTDDAKGQEAKLAELAKKNEIKNVPLTIFEGNEGPDGYEISDKADVTVLMWVNSDVKVNHAFAKGKLDKDAIKNVAVETKKILE